MYARYIPPSGGKKPSRSTEALPTPNQSSTSIPSSVTASSGDFSYSRYIPGVNTEVKPEAPVVQYFIEESSPVQSKRKRDPEQTPQESQNKKSKKSKEKRDNNEDEGDGDVEETLDKHVKKIKKEKKQKKSPLEAGAEHVDHEAIQSAKSDANGSQSVLETSEQEPTKEHRKNEKDEKKEKRQERDEEPGNPDPDDEDAEMEDADASAVLGEPTESPALNEKTKKKAKREKKKKLQDVVMDEPEDEDHRHKAVLERKVKSLKIAEILKEQQSEEEPEEEVELHGLEPLPQPEPAAPSTKKPTYETLPSWLSAPIRVSQNTRTPFTDLGILPKVTRILEDKGYTEAFAVQTAALPFLLPSGKHQPGDLLISAATGSGKTLAYALPIVRDLSNGVITRLRALIVLPTRELVKQAQEVFELCARAYDGEDRKRVRIGVAIGSQSMASEQESLMTSETRYDQTAYKEIEEQMSRQVAGGSEDPDDILTLSTTEERDPRLGPWDGQVIDFYSKVDVLICTPGRLVEHIDQTPGFSLDYVRWLVVDEADKLLAQSFQGWLDVVLQKFKISKFSARDFPDMAYSGVRKVILSATLTRDLNLLNQLALRRPRLIVLDNETGSQVAEHSLPESLREFAIRVHDVNLKPLYLLDLLRSQHMASDGQGLDVATEMADGVDPDTSSDGTSDADSDTSADSETSSDTSDSSSTSDSDSSSDSDAESDSHSNSTGPPPHSKLPIPMSLVFTKSNESALRLSRLLTLLDKSLTSHISTLTSTTPTSIRRKTLRAFTTPSSPLRLVIASDLVARGIDIPKLSHVINYDLPPSVAGYVHRVGRTARAGREGCAWTLVGDGESGWFWGKIAKGAGVRRAQKVERVRIEEMSEERVEEYENALENLGKEAVESRRR